MGGAGRPDHRGQRAGRAGDSPNLRSCRRRLQSAGAGVSRSANCSPGPGPSCRSGCCSCRRASFRARCRRWCCSILANADGQLCADRRPPSRCRRNRSAGAGPERAHPAAAGLAAAGAARGGRGNRAAAWPIVKAARRIDGAACRIVRAIAASRSALGDIALIEWLNEHAKDLRGSERLAWVTGWTSDVSGAKLRRALDACDVRYILRLADAPAGTTAPLVLSNPAWARAFEVFARMLGTPGQNESDPSQILAVVASLDFRLHVWRRGTRRRRPARRPRH